MMMRVENRNHDPFSLLTYTHSLAYVFSVDFSFPSRKMFSRAAVVVAEPKRLNKEKGNVVSFVEMGFVIEIKL